ncbi:MAG TPA: phosphoadenosine phosphosulfate reductase family protein, partial [Clostridiales bacterium]|nr:phosphoadenosine phosphosulfate reductase family protein [Clostridiales bacterium]
MQSWPLERKIQVTQAKINEWYIKWEGEVFVSFSGGKDSTVLLDLARRCYPDIEAVFCDTGLEYPEIREFVKSKENVTWLHPLKYDRRVREYVRTSFKDVIKTYGYPVISKEVSRDVSVVKNNPKCKTADKFNIDGEHAKKYGAQFSKAKYKYLIDAPFAVSNRCCDAMKKVPVKQYELKSGKHQIVGTMACESQQRRSNWLLQGCNAFDAKHPVSKPLSFWTEQDIFQYLKRFKIPYASIYGDIVENEKGELYTTGANRTGCMFCMFGVHLEKEPNRFQRMKETHPKLYEYCMKDIEQGGLGLKRVLKYINVP